MRDNSKIFVISDLHLDHRNIIKYCNRPFKDVNEMNEILINNWNRVVTDNDRIFCLGDFCLSGKNKIIELGNRLKGRKTLILGNHEHASLKTYYMAGFEIVSKYPILLNDIFILSHRPLKKPQYFNIHGHIHEKNIQEIDYIEKPYDWYYNVSCDVHNFSPVSYKEICSRFNIFV